MRLFSNSGRWTRGTVPVMAIVLLAALAPAARADVLLDNLTQQPTDVAPADGTQVGVSILVASQVIQLSSVVISQTSLGNTPGETFSIASRNADGTVGTPLFTDFSVSFNSNTNLTTVTPNTPVVLGPNAGYWLLLSSPSSSNLHWDYSKASGYFSQDGVTLPADHTSVITDSSGTGYYTLLNGPQMLQVNGTAVPEPSVLALAAASTLGLLLRRRPQKMT